MSFFSKLCNALHPKRLDDELRAEMSDHLERRAAALREQGLSPDDAQHEAMRRFGNMTQLREQSREFRLSSTAETALQDLRYAVRGMRKSPAFAATAILSLALAIGANTAIYSIVDAALLRPLPVAEPDRLFTLATPYVQQPGRERPAEDVSFSYPLFQQFRAAAGDSARLALFGNPNQTEVQIPNQDAPIEKAVCQYVSADSFDILGIPPALGRVFSIDEDRVPGGHPYLVISYDYWQRRFRSDPHVLGQQVRIGSGAFTIVGVARHGFFGVEPGKFADIWIPAMMFKKAALTNNGWGWLRILGRLSPGVTRARLLARLQPVFKADQAETIRNFPLTPAAIQNQYRERPLLIHPGATGASNFQTAFERPLWIVLGVAAGTLLIACANVASLLLARSTARASEMAMRVSLGAGRSRLIRQLLTESLLLSLIAGVLGWLFAQAAAPALVAALSNETDPVRFALSMDTRVLLFCAAVSTLAAVFFGLLPAWQASASKPMRELYGVRGQTGKLRLGRAFVGIQVAFAFTLVIGGSSFLFSLKNLSSVNAGFTPHNVAVISIVSELSDATPRSEVNAFLDELQGRVEALPGIQSAAFAQWALFDGSHNSTQIILPGQPPSDREENSISVSPHYFATMRIPLLAGREFASRDRGDSSPVIVNTALARRYFGGENAVGKSFEMPANGKRVSHEIVGVVADTVYGSLREGPQPIVYSIGRETNFFACYLRSPLDLGSIVPMVEREARAVGHGARVRSVTTLDTLIGDTLLREKLLAGLGGVFAFLGLLLAAIGLFGLLNYSVIRRTKEIGIRAALGARPPSLVFLVLEEMFITIAGGLMAGLIAALSLMTFVRSLLFGIRPVDPLVMLTAAAAFLAAAIIAGGLPAARAAGIDPMIALRHD